MRPQYKITKIVHSGRKGIRGEPVQDEKYDGLIDSVVTLRWIRTLEECEQFTPLKMNLIKTDTCFDTWYTSEVIQIALVTEDVYEVETVNAIYYFQLLTTPSSGNKR